jgi:hypothetical protein
MSRLVNAKDVDCRLSADNPAGEEVDDEHDVHNLRPRHDLGEVGDPIAGSARQR